jgi:hypothetical protein
VLLLRLAGGGLVGGRGPLGPSFPGGKAATELGVLGAAGEVGVVAGLASVVSFAGGHTADVFFWLLGVVAPAGCLLLSPGAIPAVSSA